MSDIVCAEEAQSLQGLEVEVMKVPVLSTGHVTEQSRAMLDSGHPQWVHHCARYEFGWFIAVPTEDFQNTLDPQPPEDLAALFAWARKNEFGWIRLDSDGSQVDDLHYYA